MTREIIGDKFAGNLQIFLIGYSGGSQTVIK